MLILLNVPGAMFFCDKSSRRGLCQRGLEKLLVTASIKLKTLEQLRIFVSEYLCERLDFDGSAGSTFEVMASSDGE
jgi:hypothetical protein